MSFGDFGGRSFDTHSLECPDCQSRLPLSGTVGTTGQTGTTSCPSCHSVLEISADGSLEKTGKVNQTLTKFLSLPLGAAGKLRGHEWTIIGRMVDDWVGETGRTGVYVLYNDTEGYAYLDEESGHFSLSRDVPDGPEKSLFGYKPKQKFKHNGKSYRFTEKGRVTLAYLDGSIPWAAELDEESRYAEGIAPPLIFTEERSKKEDSSLEVEYFTGEYIPANQIKKAFGVKVKPRGVGAAQPYRAMPFEKGLLRLTSLVALALIVGFFYTAFQGERFFTQSFKMHQLLRKDHLSKPFEVTRKGETLAIQYKVMLKNRWAEYGIALLRENDANVIIADDGYLEYYSGYEGGERWSEGRRSRTHYWKVEQPGTYRVLTTIRSTDDRRGRTRVTIRISRRVQRSFVLGLLALFWPIVPVYLFVRRRGFEKRRWGRIL